MSRKFKQLADAVGFRYAYDPDSKQYAHASAIMVLTPEGKISRYFYGVQYPERDLRLGLVEASQGKIGSPVDQVLLFCYHYDPHTGKYGLLISRVIQLGGLANGSDRRNFSDFPCSGASITRCPAEGHEAGAAANRAPCKGSQRNGDDGLPSIRIGIAGGDGGQIPLQPPAASSIADGVDQLYYFLTGITLFFTVLIFSIIFYFMVKYRRQSPDETGAWRNSRAPGRWSSPGRSFLR